MKIPNLNGQNYETILSTVRGIVESVKKSDKQARENGELLKYVIEIYDVKDGENILEEVREIYSKHYLFSSEVLRDLKLGSKKHEIRGPFPLFEGSISDAKLNRWEIEKEKQKNDSTLIDNHIKLKENENYKYAYIVYEEVMGVERFVELTFSDSSMPKSQIEKVMKSSSVGKRNILRINLSNKEEKKYHC